MGFKLQFVVCMEFSNGIENWIFILEIHYMQQELLL